MYKNILIATDGSELASQGLTHGLELAKALNVPATVVTTTKVWSTIEMAHQVEGNSVNPLEQYEKFRAEQAQEILSSAETVAKNLGVSCDYVHVKDRHPADGIIETAAEKGCDLIVMASHGWRGIKQVLLGSVASEVLAHSKVPVLIVR